MVTRIPARMIETTGVTAGSYSAADITVNSAGQITSASTSSVASSGGGPKITSIVVTDSSYTNIDDTAVGLSGGYIKVTGTGFSAGCSIIIGSLVATSVSFINSTEVRAQVPAQSAGTYTVYLSNSDGGVAIRVNGLNYSSTPTWTTTSPLAGAVKNTSISLQLIATSNSTVTYTLQAGSSLPSGLTLSSSGLITGTTPNVTNETTYNFTVVATDLENQDTPQAFQITIVVNDPYYRLVTLHLPGTGTNLATNNTFLDASTNNFTITRSGNTTQGTFSPFSPNGWSNFYNSTYTNWPANTWNTLAGITFTIECWLYPIANGGVYGGMILGNNVFGRGDATWFYFSDTAKVGITTAGATNWTSFGSTNSVPLNSWSHVAITIDGPSGSATAKIYINGVLDSTHLNRSTNIPTDIGNCLTGTRGDGSQYNYYGYVSNLRITKNQVLYTGNFTPPIAALTTATVGTTGANVASSITGTVSAILYGDGRLINKVASTIADSNTSVVQAFSPFNPTASWSAATHGGSGYFDGSGDYLNGPTNTATAFNLTGDFTIECWTYFNSVSTAYAGILNWSDSSGWNGFQLFNNAGTLGFEFLTGSGAAGQVSGGAVTTGQWYFLQIVRSGSAITFYKNGTSVATTTYASSQTSSSSFIKVGVDRTAANYITGYISGIRIVNGTALSSSVPTSPPTGITNTSLLLNFTNAGVYDATSKNVLETVGNAQISTAISAKWGSGSMAFDGTGDWLKTPASTLWQFGTGDFTIEFWWYPNSLATYQQILSVIDNVGVTGAGQFAITYNTSLGLRFYINAGATTIDQGSTSGWSAGQWYYIAAVRSGNALTLYRNGSSIASGSVTGVTIGANVPVYIGGEQYTPHSNNGYLQDVRITKGYARTITASPTLAFPTL